MSVRRCGYAWCRLFCCIAVMLEALHDGSCSEVPRKRFSKTGAAYVVVEPHGGAISIAVLFVDDEIETPEAYVRSLRVAAEQGFVAAGPVRSRECQVVS